jgi:hypothetical protein
MGRQAFTPPADDTNDDILSMLASGPAKATATPKAQDAPAVPPPTAPAVPAAPTAAAEQVPAPSPPAARLTRRATPTATHRASSRTMPMPDPATGPDYKRVGLYLNPQRWLWLKRLSVERAEQGLPPDFTSIVLEALDEKYGR